MLENVPGARADIRAKVVDFNENGIRIHVSLMLGSGHTVGLIFEQTQENLQDEPARDGYEILTLSSNRNLSLPIIDLREAAARSSGFRSLVPARKRPHQRL